MQLQSLAGGRFAGLHAMQFIGGATLLKASELRFAPQFTVATDLTAVALPGTVTWTRSMSRDEDVEHLSETIPIEWLQHESIHTPTDAPIQFGLTDAEAALWELGDLGENWDNEGSAAADWRSVRQALRFLDTFRGLALDWHASLHADGRAMLETHTDTGRAYFQFGPGDTFVGFAAPHGQLPPATALDMAHGDAMGELAKRLKSLRVLV